MAAPAHSKTWTYSFNNMLEMTTTATLSSQGNVWKIKEVLKALGWTVIGSCNSTTAGMDGVDRWVTSANVTFNGSAHSWIVFSNSTLAQGAFYLLIDCNSGTPGYGTIRISDTVAFTGGSTTLAPTATGSGPLVNSAAIYSFANFNVQGILHGWMSSDLKVTYLAITYNGVVSTMVGIGALKNLCSGTTTTTPYFGFWQSVGTNVTLVPNTGYGRRFSTGTPELFDLGGHWALSRPLVRRPYPRVGAYAVPFFPVVVGGQATGTRGVLGAMEDLYWSGDPQTGGILPGDRIMDSGNNWISVGSLFMPWDGTTQLRFK